MYTEEKKKAIDAVVSACALCRHVQETLVTAETLEKKDKSPVTIADYGVQALVNHALADAFPEDPVTAEEDADDLRRPDNSELLSRVMDEVRRIDPGMQEDTMLDSIDRGHHPGGASGRFWTLDPIDGTKGFIRGDQYAVALALIEEGRVVLGVLGCPNLAPAGAEAGAAKGVIYAAVKDGGTEAFDLSGQPLGPVSVSRVEDPSLAAFCESVESGHTKQGRSARVADLLGVQVPPVRLDSQCKYAVVAGGDAAIYMRLPAGSGYVEKIWDHAAGCIVVVEAGGTVTDIDGLPLDFSRGRRLETNTGIIATNGPVHEAVLAAVRESAGA